MAPRYAALATVLAVLAFAPPHPGLGGGSAPPRTHPATKLGDKYCDEYTSHVAHNDRNWDLEGCSSACARSEGMQDGHTCDAFLFRHFGDGRVSSLDKCMLYADCRVSADPQPSWWSAFGMKGKAPGGRDLAVDLYKMAHR